MSFGRKNATTLMTGGGVLLGWSAVYIFWKESKKAEEKIRYEEEQKEEKLPTKEKVAIYLQYCWLSCLMGLASTGLCLWSHKLSMDEIAKWYMVSQFMENKVADKDKLIEKLKEEVPDKKIHELENDILEEEYPREEIIEEIMSSRGEPGQVLFIDKVTHNKFRADILDVTDGIMEFNKKLKDKRGKDITKQTKKAIADRLTKDPFFSSDKPYNQIIDLDDLKVIDEEDYPEIYSALDLDEFLRSIGELDADDYEETALSDLLEFRYYGGGDLIKPTQILKYKEYVDPNSGMPVVCFIDYGELLSPSSELLERNPL